MAKTQDLTEHAAKGYAREPNPHAYSSPAWYAHAIGEHLRATGRPAPRDVRMSRGYSVRVGDMLFKEAAHGFERIA